MNDFKIMIIDDEDVILDSIKDYFDELSINTFNNSRIAIEELKKNHYDIIIADYKMPEFNGLDLLIEAKKNQSYNYGILLTAFAEKDLLEQFVNKSLIKKIIEKPLKLDILKEAIYSALDECDIKRKHEDEFLKLNYLYNDARDEQLNIGLNNVIGINGGLKEVFEKIKSIANTDENVLITGETGTGKEVIAKTIHLLSERKNKPFIKINCGAIPDNLIESELFGYEKGAFTSASLTKIGKIELADNGTLFLDEIAELKIELQSKLLNVIQEKKLERLGSNKTINVNFRLISATNKEIDFCIKEKTFREDLYYRISTFYLFIPPLRDRTEDIKLLVEYLIDKYSKELGLKKITIDARAVEKFKNYSWQGNIRELENVIKRAILLLKKDEKQIKEKSFDYLFYNKNSKDDFYDSINVIIEKIINEKKDLKSIEKEIIKSILDKFNGNIMEAVKASGIPKDRFYRNK